MKTALKVILVLVVLVAAGLYWFLSSLDGIVKEQIEVVGSELTGVPVAVESVKLDLKNGAGQIAGLSVGNPDGYRSSNAFQMNQLRLGIDLKSLAGEPIILNELVIDAPLVNLEIKGNSSNLKDIADAIKGNAGPAEEKTAAGESGKPPLIVIRRLLIKGVTFALTGSSKASSGTLPTIELSDIGGSEGTTPARIAALIFTKLIAEILKESAVSKIEDAVDEKVDELKGGLMDNLKKALN